jgi:hypothetical protein
MPDRIDVNDLPAQRAAGWPDTHPEDYCHRCGNRNVPSWYVDSDRFNLAFGPAEQHPYNGIVCPTCFVLAWQDATGLAAVWKLVPENIHAPAPVTPKEPPSAP